MENTNPPATPPLIVVSGPSGVGKTTVVERLLANTRLRLRRAITATTRDRRPGETGTDYHFWKQDEFERAIAVGEMLEHAVVFGKDYYGTPRSEVEPYREQGQGVILVIDVQGAARIRDLGLEHLSVFIEPPDLTELESRLRGRGDMTEDRIQRRLNEAQKEMDRAGEFQHRIVNRDITEAVRELEQVIRERFKQ